MTYKQVVFLSALTFAWFISCMDRENKAPGFDYSTPYIPRSNDSSVVYLFTQLNDTLDLVSDADVVWEPLGCSPDPDTIQKINPNINFLSSDSTPKFKMLSYKGSILILEKNAPVPGASELAEYRHTSPEPWSISYGCIANPGIHYSSGIHLGMTKAAFLSIFFPSQTKDFSSVRLIRLYDPTGEIIAQHFIFENDVLSKIELKKEI